MPQNGAINWQETEAGKELQARFADTHTLQAMTRILERMDTLEKAIDKLAVAMEQGPGMVSMVTDIADEAAQRAMQRGVDIDQRLQNALHLAEKLTAPEMVEKLEGMLAMANQLPDTLSMVTDMADETVARAMQRGVDIDQRLQNALHLAEKLTAPEMVEKLEGMLAMANQLPDTLSMVTDMADETA
ncbi:MAG: hypothetical protein D6730_09735, partial [Bacteroidetes bacterium]